MWIGTTAITILFPALAIFIVIKSLFSSKRRKPPSPPKIPIFGNLLQLGDLPHRTLKAFSDTYGPILLLQLGSVPTLVVSSSDVAKEIFESHDIAFADRASTAIGQRLLYNHKDLTLTPYSIYWRKVRAIFVTKLLSSNKVKSFHHVREEETAIMISKIEAAGPSGVNLSDVFSAYTNDVVCRVAFGKRHVDDKKKTMKAVDECSQLLGVFDVGTFVPWLAWINYFNGLHFRVEAAFKDLDSIMDTILQEHIMNQKDDGKDFVDILLEVFSEEGSVDTIAVKAMIIDVFVGGTETVKTSMEWVMVELLRNGEAMKKVKDEIREVMGDRRTIKEDDLNRMKYTKAAIKEAMRLHPPIPILPIRVCRERVEVRGYEIEEKTMLLVNLWAIGRDPTVWEAPEEFRPDRFIESRIDYLGNDFEFIPFGAGRRRCPGISFAASAMEIGIASLLMKFDFVVPQGKDFDTSEAGGLTVHPTSLLVYATPSYI